MDHDAAYKHLFAFPEMVADLLREFVPEPWVNEIDFSTLERVSGSYVSDDLRTREEDMVWRVRVRGQWVYIYSLLEFQTQVEPYMAVRIVVYVGLLYQDLIRRGEVTPDRRLPPVVPIVLYSGERRWTAAMEVGELVWQGPPGLEAYRTQQRYLLLSERELGEATLPVTRNLAAALFRLQASRELEDVAEVVRRLVEWLAAPEHTGLRRAFVVWLRRVLLPQRLPGVALPEVQELQEVRDMLQEAVIDWTAKWKQEGRQEGRQEGWQEGRQEGLVQAAREDVLAVLEVRFGAVPEAVQAAVERIADVQRLKQLLRQAILVPSVEDFVRWLAADGNGAAGS